MGQRVQAMGLPWRGSFCGQPLVFLRIHLPMQEPRKTQVQFLSWEDPLEKEMATQSNILAWEIPWTEEPGRLLSMGWQRGGHD